MALRRAGISDFVILEKADQLGGTWRDNTYPGCACDVPSHLYSFSTVPNPEWSRVFAPAGEIQRYLLDVAGQLSGSEARFMLADAGAPTLIHDMTDDHALYVLMPMRV